MDPQIFPMASYSLVSIPNPASEPHTSIFRAMDLYIYKLVLFADGSVCVTKVRFVEKLEKQQIKECWHQNVTSCHDTSVTEFKAMQEKKCNDTTY